MYNWQEKSLIDEVKDLIARVENSVDNEWVTLKDKEGEPYHVNIDEKEDKEKESKQADKPEELKIKKTTVKMKSGKEKEIEFVEEVPKGYKVLEGAMTAPLGYTWYTNGKSLLKGEHKSILVKDKPSEQTKEEKKIETTDEYGRIVIHKPNSHNKVKIKKDGDYYFASYGQQIKDDDGYEEFQVYPSASGKTFKTLDAAKRWAYKILEIEQPKQMKLFNAKEIFCEVLAELLAEKVCK